MRKTFFTICLACFAMTMVCCTSQEKSDAKKGEAGNDVTFADGQASEYTELTKTELRLDKDSLYNAWKEIGTIELQRKKVLDYRQHTPTLFFPTDLDGDGQTEVLLRGEPPYAAIFTCTKDSARLVTFVDQAEMGLAITPDGCIIRNGIEAGGSTVSEFLKLEDSRVKASGAMRETFVIKDNAMVSGGTQYMLRTDTTMLKVSKDEYMKVAPQHEGTYLEDIEGWEDFRQP